MKAKISRQLQHPDFRFILVRAGEKIPVEKRWASENNYPYNSRLLTSWIRKGGNYGVCCGWGGLVGIDADAPAISEIFEREFGDTFRVRSGSGRGLHDYARITDMKRKVIFQRNGKHLGEAQYLGQFLVGPGSRHPSGGLYEVIKDAEIKTISLREFEEAYKGYIKRRPERIQIPRTEPRWQGKFDIQSIPLTSFLDIRGVWRGEEIQGANPWHSSTSGVNTSLNTVRNIWYCHRCQAGGGVAKAIALNERIIKNCDERLTRAQFLRVLQIANEKYVVNKSVALH